MALIRNEKLSEIKPPLTGYVLKTGQKWNHHCTGKSFSAALILASTNPQYDKRLSIELRVQCTKTTSSEHVVHINCSECQNKKPICVHNMFWTCSFLVFQKHCSYSSIGMKLILYRISLPESQWQISQGWVLQDTDWTFGLQQAGQRPPWVWISNQLHHKESKLLQHHPAFDS